MPSRRMMRRVGAVLVGAGVLASALLGVFVRGERTPRRVVHRRLHDHERTDASGIGVLGAGLGLLLMLAVGLVVVSWIYRDFTGYRVTLHPPAAGIQNPPQRPVTAEPRLEVTPGTAMADYRAAQERLLDGYGWVDERQGVARIPIGRALDLLAERGLPARQSPPPRPPTPIASASGRFLSEATSAAGEASGGLASGTSQPVTPSIVPEPGPRGARGSGAAQPHRPSGTQQAPGSPQPPGAEPPAPGGAEPAAPGGPEPPAPGSARQPAPESAQAGPSGGQQPPPRSASSQEASGSR